MSRRMLTISQKLAIPEEAKQTGSIEITARVHELRKIQIMNWGVNKEELIEKRKLSRKDIQSIQAALNRIKKSNYRSLNGFMVRAIVDFLFLQAT